MILRPMCWLTQPAAWPRSRRAHRRSVDQRSARPAPP
jgi:hypothetical protein